MDGAPLEHADPFGSDSHDAESFGAHESGAFDPSGARSSAGRSRGADAPFGATEFGAGTDAESESHGGALGAGTATPTREVDDEERGTRTRGRGGRSRRGRRSRGADRDQDGDDEGRDHQSGGDQSGGDDGSRDAVETNVEGATDAGAARGRRGGRPSRSSGGGGNDSSDDDSGDDSSDGEGGGRHEDERYDGNQGEDDDAPKKRRRRGSRGGRRRRKAKERAEQDVSDADGSAGVDADGDGAGGADTSGDRNGRATAASDPVVEGGRTATRGTRRRRRRSSLRDASTDAQDGPERDRESSADETEGGDALSVDAIPGEDDDFGGSSRRSSGRRSKRRRTGRGSGASESDTESGSDDGDDSESEHRSAAPRKRRRSKKKEVLVPEAEPKKRKSSRKRPGGARAKDTEDDEPARDRPSVERDQIILVNAVDPEETRVVVQQGDRIVDLVMTVDHHKSFVNDIYRGRVVNIEDAIGAAFVDFGQGKNGFLHASDVMHIYGDDNWSVDKLLTARTDADEWGDDVRAPTESIVEVDEDAAPSGGRSRKKKTSKRKTKGRALHGRGRKRKSIAELLKRGQIVVSQITKDAIGDKGPTLTTYISIPGRYLVLMPSLEKTGVSRKIDDDRERRRLKRILQSLDIPDGMGVIVRTAGVGKTKEEIRRDLDYLLAVWGQFSKQLVLGRNPAPLYQESAVAIRTMRDLFSSRTKAVIVDDESVYEEMIEFTKKLMPEHVDRIELHDGDRPLFHTFGLEQDFERLFSRRVELPSGGSIVFDQTEALVAIDVNSGRTRDEGADFEDIALKANLEAVPEIARQIKLRDLGGIIVCDFIDMLRPASRRKVEKALATLLTEDRARSKLGRISQFGLLELTRQRLGPGLSTLLYEPCNYCRGTGRRRTAQSKAQAVLRRLGSALTQKGFTKVEILVHPDTLEWLKRHDWKQVEDLERKSKRELVFVSAEEQYEDSVFHYLRADGREVRPGGRRRR